MNEIESLELKIAKFLRYGVLFAGLIIVVGWVMLFKFSGNPFFNFDTYDRIPFIDLVKFNIHRKNWGALVSYSGLIALISLPLIRVFMTIFLFLKQKEFALAGIALIVLSGLIASMFLGIEL